MTTISSVCPQDRIYWTDRDRAAVFMANRLTGQDIHTLAENLNDPHDIVVFHQLRQPQGVCACLYFLVLTNYFAFRALCVCLCGIHGHPLWRSDLCHISVTKFSPRLHINPGAWINDAEACDGGRVIKAVGGALDSHICHTPASNSLFPNKTIQI